MTPTEAGTPNPDEPPVSDNTNPGDDPPARLRQTARAVRANAIQQALGLTIASLILDGGTVLRGGLIAALGSWAMSALILERRRGSPTTFDLALLRYGFWICLILTAVLARWRSFAV